MEFGELEKLKREISSLLEQNVISLKHYHLDNFCGFRHFYEPRKVKNYFSKASTATCILSLTSTGRWSKDQRWWFDKTELLNRELLKPKNWQSAGLPANNPFTVAFILEAVLALGEINPGTLVDPTSTLQISKAVELLKRSIITVDKNDPHSVKGAANILKYPPSTYLTQLVFRVLEKSRNLTKSVRKNVCAWAWRQVEHELSLIYSKSRNIDPLSLAYAVILITSSSDISDTTPDDNQILRSAFDSIFDAQLPDGSWPRSRPLFHYPEVGNAYCFEYEMLAQLLQQKELRNLALRHLPELKLATEFLKQSVFRFEEGGMGWASGHHPQLPGPESWSTASIYHFLYELDRTLAEAIRQSIFNYAGAEYISPVRLTNSTKEFAADHLDSKLRTNGRSNSLKKILLERFIKKIANHSKDIELGRPLPANVPISAVLFGPPGTAKTKLGREIADFLGWPLLTIDPSHLVRRGLDQIQAETNTLFSMLAAAESIVVLLDEFDELVRERKSEQSEILSRFLTTAMLPKLAHINERKRLVFIVITNHIDQFDFAIRRPGRFDLIVQIMPPSVEEKLKYWDSAREQLDNLKIDYSRGAEIEKQLNDLTYLEFDELAKKLKRAKNPDRAKSIIQEAHEHCILSQEVLGQQDVTWAEICEDQRKYIRVPGI